MEERHPTNRVRIGDGNSCVAKFGMVREAAHLWEKKAPGDGALNVFYIRNKPKLSEASCFLSRILGHHFVGKRAGNLISPFQA